jgi:hypothetical protein
LKYAHIIWHNTPSPNIREGYNDVHGIVIDDYETAEEILQHLNDNDPERPTYGNPRYWRESYPILTLQQVIKDTQPQE